MSSIYKHIFLEIHTLLESKISDYLNFSEDEGSLRMDVGLDNSDESFIWIEYEEEIEEITVGYGVCHRHFSEEYEGYQNLKNGFETFINLLVTKKRRTEFFRGESVYKCDYEIEEENNEYEDFGSVRFLNFKFWKKTKRREIYQNEVIKLSEISLNLRGIFEKHKI